jgi:hypothetical protein
MFFLLFQDSPRNLQCFWFENKLITDKSGAGKLGSKVNRLRGTPAIFNTQVIDLNSAGIAKANLFIPFS